MLHKFLSLLIGPCFVGSIEAIAPSSASYSCWMAHTQKQSLSYYRKGSHAQVNVIFYVMFGDIPVCVICQLRGPLGGALPLVLI